MSRRYRERQPLRLPASQHPIPRPLLRWPDERHPLQGSRPTTRVALSTRPHCGRGSWLCRWNSVRSPAQWRSRSTWSPVPEGRLRSGISS